MNRMWMGLRKTGITLEKIPNIQDMNDILGEIGWGAVCVDGFSPPSAFMEFQAYKVLVIAADIRQLEHIEYTPAPDYYSRSSRTCTHYCRIQSIRRVPATLRRDRQQGHFFSKRLRIAMTQAIRHLSINIKEDPNTAEARHRLQAQKDIDDNSNRQTGPPRQSTSLVQTCTGGP